MGKRKFRLLRRRDEFQSHYTVLDIGTEFVKALVVKREEDKGIVLGVGQVRIDGYGVTNPIDFQGHVVEITVFNTFSPLTHIGALQTIAQELDLELVATVAEPYALARGCSSDESYEMGAIFIDVGGGTTD